ncbi:MAG: hypothetical protein JWQ66_3227 [Mucilaginibacter sp.]|nr:hypothetical protein [Mucilaginibacter sp.]
MKKVIKHRFDVWQEEPLYWDLIVSYRQDRRKRKNYG